MRDLIMFLTCCLFVTVLLVTSYEIYNKQEIIEQLSTQVENFETQNVNLKNELSTTKKSLVESQEKSKEFLQEAISCYREMDMNDKGLEE